MNPLVLISANAEWKAVREIIAPAGIESTPLGETFTTTLGMEAPGTVTRFFHGGWGKISAAATTQFVIDRWKPELLVNLGTCGGFEGEIERGTVILVEKTLLYDIIEQMTDPEEAIAHYATEMDLTWLKDRERRMEDNGVKILRGLLVSADRDILPADIDGLVEKYKAVAADWESGAIAWVAKRNGVRCLILRGVSDLVSAEGGEAYGNIELFHENTHKVMGELIGMLGELLQESS